MSRGSVNKKPVNSNNYKHLTCFVRIPKPKGQEWIARCLCLEPIAKNTAFTNDPNSDADCPACLKEWAKEKQGDKYVRAANPMNRSLEVILL